VVEATLVATYDYNGPPMALSATGRREGVMEKRFDSAGALFSTTKTDWGYDDLGRLTSEARDEGNDGLGADLLPDAGDYKHTYAYDLAGKESYVLIGALFI